MLENAPRRTGRWKTRPANSAGFRPAEDNSTGLNRHLLGARRNMEEQITPINPNSFGEEVMYTERAISGSTFLGGPLAGMYLIAHNFKTMGKDTEAKYTWIIGLIVTLIGVPLIISITDRIIPESLSRMFHFLWLIPVYGVVKHYQEDAIGDHLFRGGKKGSAWKAAGIGLVAMIVLLLYIVVISIATTKSISDIPQFEHSIIQMEFSGCKVYYDSTAISQSDARVAGAILEKVGYFNPTNPDLDALFYKQDGKHIIAFGVGEKAFSNEQIEGTLKEALKDLQKAYGNRKYQFRLLAMDSIGIQDEKFIQLN
jgi:hypothetical protein